MRSRARPPSAIDEPLSKVGTGRLALFASGDFAFNLYWQSVMLYLLFFYTEAVHLPIGIASICYAAASGWDGIVSLAIGLMLRRIGPQRLLPQRMLLVGTVPLGASFALVYAAPPVAGPAAAAWLLTGQMLFRTLYALTNIPYLVMSARISGDPRERTLVAGGRMIAGMLAAIVVAMATLPLGRQLTGTEGGPAFLASAGVFAGVASLILSMVALTFRDGVTDQRTSASNAHAALWTVWHNPAFRWFAAATILMIVPITVLDKSVLYYFTYTLKSDASGRLTLGAMMAVSGVAIPLWTALSRFLGLHGVWVVAIGTCLAALVAFITFDPAGILAVQAFLVVMQAGAIGFSFTMWAVLPEVIEHGRQIGDSDAEAVAYGWLALLQRVAIGGGTLLLGLGFGHNGISAGSAWLRLSLTVVPLCFLLLSGLLMLLNPYARRRHRSTR